MGNYCLPTRANLPSSRCVRQSKALQGGIEQRPSRIPGPAPQLVLDTTANPRTHGIVAANVSWRTLPSRHRSAPTDVGGYDFSSEELWSALSNRAILNPNGVAPPLRQRATTPLGLADTTRFSQGSSRLATLGFGTESLWDSLEFQKGIGSIPSGIGHSCPPVCAPTTPLTRPEKHELENA